MLRDEFYPRLHAMQAEAEETGWLEPRVRYGYFPVNADGSTGAGQKILDTAGTPDGMAVDDAGNVYVATTAGIRIFKPDGSQRGSLVVPEPPSNLGFGGADRKTLFISARTSIYQIQLQVPGKP